MNNFDSQIILITGAARSGKSHWAELLANNSDQSVIYIATALTINNDPEWSARIKEHQDRRPSDWETQEVAINLPEAIANAPKNHCLLVDSLGTWVANCLKYDDEKWMELTSNLINNSKITQANIIYVAEETGWGIIPSYESGRKFRDRLGILTRQIGLIADPVYLVVAGYLLNLRQLAIPLPE